MKKLLFLVVIMICTLLVFNPVILNANGGSYATERSEQDATGIHPVVCGLLIECSIGFICWLGKCIFADDGPLPSRVGCLCENNRECSISCGRCGFKSTGTGPMGVEHTCN